MVDTQQKVAVVSGGSKGLGLALCQGLLERGYKVATFSRKSSEQLEQLSHQYDGSLFWQSIDITDAKGLSAFLKEVKSRFGRIGYLVNSAGMANEGLLTTMKESDISRMVSVNLEGALLLSKLCVKQMMVAQHGAIVNISSIVGHRGYKGVSAYASTKAALDGMTRAMSAELGAMGIRVNSVSPGFMETDMTATLTDKQKARITRRTPLGRLGTVKDVSDVVAFLLSDEARFVTGQTITVDGGFTA